MTDEPKLLVDNAAGPGPRRRARPARRPRPKPHAGPRDQLAVAAHAAVRPGTARADARTGWPSPGCATACAGGTAPSARRSPTRAGRWTDSPPGSRTCRSRSSATRWAAGPRCTPPATPRCARSSGSRRGSSPAIRSTRSPGAALLIVHGAADRMTDPRASAAFARRAEPRRGIGDLRVAWPARSTRCCAARRLWHGLAAGFVAATVLGRPPDGIRRTSDTAKVLSRCPCR